MKKILIYLMLLMVLITSVSAARWSEPINYADFYSVFFGNSTGAGSNGGGLGNVFNDNLGFIANGTFVQLNRNGHIGAWMIELNGSPTVTTGNITMEWDANNVDNNERTYYGLGPWDTGSDINTGSANYACQLELRSDTDVIYATKSGTTICSFDPEDTWYTYVMVADLDNDQCAFAVYYQGNGSLVPGCEAKGLLGQNNAVESGGFYNPGANNYNGQMDNLSIYAGNGIEDGNPGYFLQLDPVASFNTPPSPGTPYTNNTVGQTYEAVCSFNGEPRIYAGTTNPPTTLVADATGLGTNLTSWVVNTSIFPSDDTYYLYSNCSNATSEASGIRTFILDSVDPNINLHANSSINATSTHDIYLNNLYLSFNIFDAVDLDAFALVIKDYDNDTIRLNFTNNTLAGTSWNYTTNIDTTNYAAKLYNVSVMASDSHTAQAIEDYSISEAPTRLTFETAEGNTIHIDSFRSADWSTTKSLDRYSITFAPDSLDAQNKYKFQVWCDKGFRHKENTGYDGHLTCMNWETRQGNWLDFEGSGADVGVTDEGDGWFEIEVEFEGEEVTFNSIGGLNINQVDYTYNKSFFDVPNATIDPSIAIPNSDLAFYCAANTGQGEPVSYDWQVWNSTNVYANGTNSSVSPGNSLIYSLDSSFTTAGDNWTFSCRSYTTASANKTQYINSSPLYIVDFLFDNCTTANVTSLNVVFYEADGTNISIVDFSAFFEYGITSTFIANYSTSADTNNATFCIYPETVSYLSDFLLVYNNLTYNAQLFNLSSDVSYIELYLQENTVDVTFTVTDFSNNEVEDAIIQILKWDVPTNSYKVTEILQTDSNGEAVGEITLATEYYKFIVVYNGVVKLVDPETQGIKIYATTRTFKINLDDTEWYDDYNTALGIYANLTFNNVTNSFVFSWVDPTSEMTNGCLRVTQTNNTGTTTLSDSCTLSAASSIVHAITPINGSRYLATSYFEFGKNQYIFDVLEVNYEGGWEVYKIDRGWGNMMAFMLIFALAFIGLPFPELSFVLMSVGLISTAVLGLWEVTMGLVAAIIILGLIHVWKNNRQ